MGEKCALYLKWSDTVARALDNVVVSAYEPVIALGIAPCNVACIVVLAAENSLGQLGILVVAAEKTRRTFFIYAAYRDASLFTVLALCTIGTEQVDVVKGRRLSC